MTPGPSHQALEHGFVKSILFSVNISFFLDVVISHRAKREVVSGAPGLTTFTRPVRG